MINLIQSIASMEYQTSEYIIVISKISSHRANDAKDELFNSFLETVSIFHKTNLLLPLLRVKINTLDGIVAKIIRSVSLLFKHVKGLIAQR